MGEACNNPAGRDDELTRFKRATAAVETAKSELEASRKALAEAHNTAAIEPDLEKWREAHDAFCIAAGYCFTHGSTDCPTRARIAGLKAVAPLILKLRAAAPASDTVLVEALETAREELRVLMLDQPTTGRRETYSDGFAMGLSHAIHSLDCALAARGEQSPDGDG
jgi:hypothetical protein